MRVGKGKERGAKGVGKGRAVRPMSNRNHVPRRETLCRPGGKEVLCRLEGKKVLCGTGRKETGSAGNGRKRYAG